MVDVEWDVAALTEELITTNWSLSGTPNIRLYTEGDTRIDTANSDYILISEQSERNKEYNPSMETSKQSASARVEIQTAESRAKREELWNEVMRIAEENRRQREADSYNGKKLGGWDKLETRTSTFEDEVFNSYVAEVTFRFKAGTRVV